MRKLWPSSLFGQVMASVAIALLIAQAISVVLLFRAGEDRRELAALTGTAFQLASGAERAARQQALEDERFRRRALVTPSQRRPEGLSRGTTRALPRALRYRLREDSPFGADEFSGEGRRETILRDLLLREGIDPLTVAVAVRRAGDDPAVREFVRDRPRFAAGSNWQERPVVIAAIQRETGAPWEVSRVLPPPRPQGAFGVLVLQTLVTFATLMVILFFLLRRITRPLGQLTARVGDFSRQPDRAVRLDESGPADTRRLIAAYNTMESRIAALLDEKDVMLGAIGHDLKTPLAALRVRIESVPDEVQRQRMADSIEDITATLDDILALARVGRVGGARAQGAEDVDLAALAIGIAEEFEDLGEPVTMDDQEADQKRIVARVQTTWIKRALRNLIGNAVRYGGSARISYGSAQGMAVLAVEDDGPGIPSERIADMMEPFTRGEGSRNRTTGGAGLGLTLARAIAQQHGGSLKLSNRKEGGLRAELRIPL